MLKEFSEYIVYSLLGLKYEDKISSALEFFIYDTIKIFLLLSIIIFVISIVRSYFPPERAREILSHRERFIGHVLAALLGVVTPTQEKGRLSFRDRLTYAKGYTFGILKRVSLSIVIAIAIGGFIHGYAPEGFLQRYAGKGNFFAVPLAVMVGVPLYSNAAGVMPIASALYEKGLGIGTVLAFMMSVTALSLPEMIILRKVLKPRLLAVFVGIMTIAIILVGYMFNAIL